MLHNKRVGVLITGGIASYKIPELVRQLIKKGAMVRVAMTQSAREFVTPLTLQILTKQAVLVDTFDEHNPSVVQHIEFADWCELVVVVPATANIIAKAANGLADDIVSTILLAAHAPKVVIPAMNMHMYENVATQRNIAQLVQDGMAVMEPETGFLAEGYEGKGRLPELSRIVSFIELALAKQTYPQWLAGKHVVVTAGGTKERIDPVRYITNDSSGKMGYAMAQAASWLGARVTLIATTTALPVPESVQNQRVETAQEMAQAVQAQFETSDYVVMAAAVSDYRVERPATQKMKKQAQQDLILTLVENPDILAMLGQQKTHQVVIGFAAETEALIANATAKLVRKQVDWLIANDVSQTGIGFNSDENQVTLLAKTGQRYPMSRQPKDVLALAVWQCIVAEER